MNINHRGKIIINSIRSNFFSSIFTMEKIKNIYLFLIVLLGSTHSFGQNYYQATWKSLEKYSVPEWYRDAKFGIFIHWGVYSVPAFKDAWYPNDMYEKDTPSYNHHLATYGSQDTFGYKDFIPMFKGEKFDPDAWAKLFKKAGAKYVVPVAEHHDGFAMYKTNITKWNAYNMGPHRDIIADLSKSIRKEGLIFGLSSHRAEHWFFYNNGRLINSDVNDPKYEDFYGPAEKGEKDFPNAVVSTEFLNDWLLRNAELVDKYQPQIFWFDWWIGNKGFDPYLRSFASYYYNQALNWGKSVVINYKDSSFPDHAAVLDLERGKLAGIRELPWQTDDAVDYSAWGYVTDSHYKSVQYLVDALIDIVSKNGNLLLNIGPRPDGTIPEEQENILLEMGKWLSVNGEAIYGTRPWEVFGEGPAKNIGGEQIDSKVEPFTAEDIRFTRKDDVVYAIPLVVPDNNIVIKSLSKNNKDVEIESVSLVGSREKLTWTQGENGLTINAVTKYPTKYAAVFKLKIKN